MDIRDIFEIPLFRGFTLKMQEEILDKLEYTIDHYPKGTVIIQQGSSCNALHILLDGRLNVDLMDVSGNMVRVEVIQAPRTFATPHIFAERNLFPASFTAEDDIVLVRVAKADLFTLMHDIPQLLQNFLCVSTNCNRCTISRLRVLSFRRIRSRYIYYLFEHLEDGSDIVKLEHNQVQLAEYIGVTRPALSKEINKLVDSGLIKISRNKVHILNKQALTCML